MISSALEKRASTCVPMLTDVAQNWKSGEIQRLPINLHSIPIMKKVEAAGLDFFVEYMRYGEYNGKMIDNNDFFDVLSDETRRRLLALLVNDDELCVCELCYALDMPQPKVSRHLAVMRESRVLTMRREGLWVYYRIHPILPAWAYRILDQMVQGCGSLELFLSDRKRLGGMPDRPVRCCA